MLELTSQPAKDLPSAKHRWVCGACGRQHESETLAEDCCPVEIYDVWVCPTCDEEYPDREMAVACCSPEDAPGAFLEFPGADCHSTADYVQTFLRLNHLT